MARGSNRGLKKTKIEIIPMIDTMFFLLVFFILSSLGVVKLQGINIDLPESSNAPSQAKKPQTAEILVVIDANKVITVNGKAVPGKPPHIGPILQREMIKQLGPNYDVDKASVVISADPVVPHGMVVTCIDEARQEHIKNFAIATAANNDATGGGATNTTTPK